ncbi:hypothetical protein KIL84_017211 [Mauremys mutica]|uniref:Uncharacterized protein n=1 Tax=Mauremys mutica TaxID=74926 RepID=A0A9D3X5U8_9SAUR|nr:hypothetical protein KIL84_017211 [Mauremys mutica]
MNKYLNSWQLSGASSVDNSIWSNDITQPPRCEETKARGSCRRRLLLLRLLQRSPRRPSTAAPSPPGPPLS